MNGIDVLSGAIHHVKTRGLATGCAVDSEGRICPAAALVESAGADRDLRGGRFAEKGYLEARKAFTAVIGISDSYQAIADWSDATRVRQGSKVRLKTPGDVVGAYRRAIRRLQETPVAA